jgi:hypothetical protein
VAPFLALAAALATSPPPVGADEVRFGDPKDVLSARYPSALDIRSAAMGHDGALITHSISLYRPFGEENGLRGEWYLGVAFDTDADASDVERILFIFSYERGLHGQMVDERGRRVGSLVAVDQPNPRTAVAPFSPRLLGRPASYRWFAFANSYGERSCCFDTAPNRRWVAHDIGAPEVTGPELVPPANSTWESTTIPVAFDVEDVGGSGLATWTLRHRPLGSEAWMTAETGTSGGPQTAAFTGTDGTSSQVCVQAIDRAGNVRNGELHVVTFPFDDGRLAYSGTWASAAITGAFQGTVHTSSEPGATAGFTLAAHGYPWLVVPPGYDGVATISLNGVEQGWIDASLVTTPRQRLAINIQTVDAGDTFTFTVQSGTFPIDGLLVEPSIPPPPLGAAPTCG